MNVCYHAQAFFGVFDGHGGQEGVDFVADRLGKNIVGFMKDTREEDGEDRLEMATKIGYKATDDDFFVQVCTFHLLPITSQTHLNFTNFLFSRVSISLL